MPEPAMAPGGGEVGAWVPLTCGGGLEGKRGRRRRNPRARAAGFIGGRGKLARPRWPCAPARRFYHEGEVARGARKGRRERSLQVGSRVTSVATYHGKKREKLRGLLLLLGRGWWLGCNAALGYSGASVFLFYFFNQK